MNHHPESIVLSSELSTNRSYFSIYVIFAITIILMIGGGMLYYAPDILTIDKEWLSNNVYLPIFDMYERVVSWFTGKNRVQPNENNTNYGPASITNKDLQPTEATNTFKQTWCLVGEDMTGRWCIQVPGEGACDAERSFPTKNDCEMSSK
jgi:hypothetical protein